MLLGVTASAQAADAWKRVFPNPRLTNPRMKFNGCDAPPLAEGRFAA
ncbi:MAG: hypothetical protein ACP5VQ_07765 [Phycisphaerae bacterium]